MVIRKVAAIISSLSLMGNVFGQDIKDMNLNELKENSETAIFQWVSHSLDHQIPEGAPKGVAIEQFKILAWYRERDERPIFSDHALCWAKVSTNNGPRWVIAQMWRNPTKGLSARPQIWTDYVGVHGPPSLVLFTKPPRNKEIYAACSIFKFEAQSGWMRYAQYVDRLTWASVIGEQPAKAL